MKVSLIGTSVGKNCLMNEKIADYGAAICIDRLEQAKDNAYTCKNLEAAVRSGHLSVIEHITLSFLVEDISRACSHQLVRHRLASYSQKSQKYAKVNTNQEWYVTPKSIVETDGGYYLHDYKRIMQEIAEVYNDMRTAGVPDEDARFLLPNACFTSIIMTMNARAFIEASTKRVCNRAQWEIRELFKRMRELIRETFPTVYKLSGPECTKSGCKEATPCGKMECSHG